MATRFLHRNLDSDEDMFGVGIVDGAFLVYHPFCRPSRRFTHVVQFRKAVSACSAPVSLQSAFGDESRNDIATRDAENKV